MNRNSLMRTGALTVAGIIAMGALAAVDDITLKRKPKVGDGAEYKVNATFQIEQGEVVFSQKRVEKVSEVKPDGGYVMKATVSETKISFGGQELPDQPDVTSTIEMGPDGLLKSLTSDTAPDSSSYRIANLHAFKAPDGAVKIGDEINFTIAADKDKGTPAVKISYKVAGTEKVKDWDTVKLTYTAEETEGTMKSSIKGTAWVSAVDGSQVKVQEEWKDVQPQGAPSPVSGKYNSERVK